MSLCCANGEPGLLGCRRGDTVTVRSLEEILATLDADAKLEGIPFMPEMAGFCGRTFTVFRRAERTCVEGSADLRRLENTVFLEGLRCDGSAHDGCQRGCLLFWKEAWLKPADGQPDEIAAEHVPLAAQLPTKQGDRYYCQSTELAAATSELAPGDLGYFYRDLRSGEASPWRFLHVVALAAVNYVWRRLFGRERCERLTGLQRRTAAAGLDLQPGELVEVKSAAEIQTTLDRRGRNRGLTFEPEMLHCCGRRYRVLAPVRKIISETTGRMIELSNTVILEGVTCQGICAKNCPRAHYFYWREAWLKRL
jgi:hypothetical protein